MLHNVSEIVEDYDPNILPITCMLRRMTITWKTSVYLDAGVD